MTTPVEPAQESPPSLSISLASPNDIRCWSYGRIATHELFDFEHRRFHDAGLFSERIFGPIRDYRCACGKFFGAHQIGVVCDECGVSLRPRAVRRQRMAHIELPVPIVHPWFWGKDTAPIELLLGLSHQQLRQLIARRRFIQLGTPPPHLRSALCSAMAAQVEGDRTLDGFLARSGGDAVRRLLGRIDFATLLPLLEDYLDGGFSAKLENRIAERRVDPANIAGIFQRTRHLEQRVELIRQIVRTGTVPKDAVLEALPVIPVGMRTGEVTAEGRLVVDRVTARYQRIIRWCNVIQRCLDRIPVMQGAWPTGETKRRIVWLEQRLAADIAGLFDDLLHCGSPASHAGAVRDRRRRWPGKQVEFSARSVVVPDPSLRLFECRVPRKRVAEVLFAPLIAGDSSGSPIDADALESEATKHPLVFSIPTVGESCDLISLHPRLTDDDATHVHPLVAATVGRSFADLDATIHLPLSMEAETDCDRLSFPRVHMRDAISGECKLRIAADAAVGCYYASWLSEDRRQAHDQVIARYPPSDAVVHHFASLADVQAAWEAGKAHVHDLLEVRLPTNRRLYRSLTERSEVVAEKRRAWTTVGRALINFLLPRDSPYFDVLFDEPSLHVLLQEVLETHGALAVERFVERASAFGLSVLTRVGLSLSLADFKPPDSFQAILERLKKDVSKFTRLYERGVICDAERRTNITEASTQAQETIANNHLQAIFAASGSMPPLVAILGARGKGAKDQIKRIAGIMGTVWSGWNFHLPMPLLNSLRTGVDPLGYFQLAGVARHKLLVESFPSTGPRRLKRRIASALGDVVVTEEDCGARQGVVVDRGRDEATAAAFAKRITGRVSLHRVHYTKLPGAIVAANWLITPRAAREIDAGGPSKLYVRSPLTCRARRGVCSKCYGADPATGRLVDVGVAVGVKAALAIGPTLPAIDALQGPRDEAWWYESACANVSGIVSLSGLRLAPGNNRSYVVSPGGAVRIFADDAYLQTVQIPHGADMLVGSGSEVTAGQPLATWNPTMYRIHAQYAGVVRIEQSRSGRGCRFVTIVDASGAVVDGCFVPEDAKLLIADGRQVRIGAHLANYHLPYDYKLVPANDRFERLKLLFESQPPRDQALLSPIDGRVELKAYPQQGRCTVLLHPCHGGEPLQIDVPWESPQFIIVRTGQIVQPGDPLTRGSICLGDRVRARGVDQVQWLILAEIHARLAELKSERPGDDRPWELLVAQMLRYVRIESSGDTAFEVGQIAPQCEVRSVNRALRGRVKVADANAYPTPLQANIVSRQEYELAEQQRRVVHPAAAAPAATVPWQAGWSPLLMGIDELAQQGSFLTAGGFIPTRQALVRACLERRRHLLQGVQESVAAGRLMPAGAGWSEKQRS